MNRQDASERVKQHYKVTRQHVVICESFILTHHQPGTVGMLQALLDSKGVLPWPSTVSLEGDPSRVLEQVADHISWTVAFAEAMLRLVSSCDLLPATDRTWGRGWQLHCKTSGEFGSVQLNWVPSLLTPETTMIAPSLAASGRLEILANHDLFLHELSIPGLDPDVEVSLKEAVRCFRHSTYLAAAAMLGRASEGAWISCGLALAGYVGDQGFADKLAGERVGLFKKIDDTLKKYDEAAPRMHKSEIGAPSPLELRNVRLWSDNIRLMRNAIHIRAEAPIEPSYESVAALLMGAVPNLRTVYKVIAALKSARDGDR